jgi:hypothetical protein
VTCLELFRSACEAVGAELVLTTFYYARADMTLEPRKTYAWGIDRLNDTIRVFARQHALKLIDLADALKLDSADISNKWHYTASGNTKRADLVAVSLNRKAPISRGTTLEAAVRP